MSSRAGGDVGEDISKDISKVIDAVWRIESPRLTAALARMTRDVGSAEELAQDALVAALEQWPQSGIPDNPAAWLMTTAKRRAIDMFRRNERLQRKLPQLGQEQAQREWIEPDLDADLDQRDIGDDLLTLMFTACHPKLPTDARVALTLKVLGGLSTKEIARSFLVPAATMAQRLVRAKRTLSEQKIRFEVPDERERAARLTSILEIVYLIFNEGYAATSGDDWMRPALCEEALRLGRILAGLTPQESEVHGLVALMEVQASRIPARTGPTGDPVLLLDQNRARWDRVLIQRGLSALDTALDLAERHPGEGAFGPYTLQAAIAAVHARARTAEETDWSRLAALYQLLHARNPSPVVALNQAVAVGMAHGPNAGLRLVDQLRAEPALRDYHLLPSVRGDLLAKLGRRDEAQAEFERAAALTRNERERKLLLARAAECAKE